MKAIFMRRLKLGRKSCRGIRSFSKHIFRTIRNDRDKIPPGTELIIRWGCTDHIPKDIPVINSAEAISLVNDKTEFRKVLQKDKLCPETWFDIEDVKENNFPVIVRPGKHAQGKQLYLCKNKEELTNACDICDNYYISKFIDKVSEYRVMIVQGRVAWVAGKTPGNPKDIAWNVARGGKFENVKWDDWNLRMIKTAIQGFNLTDLDFGAVDIMVDKDNNCFILEINSGASQTSPYRQECVAKCLDYAIENGKDKIPLIQEKGGYKKFIHPAICEDATVGENVKKEIPQPKKDKEWEKKEILKLIPKKKCFEYPPHNGDELKNNAYVSLDEHGRISIHMNLDSWLGTKLENFEFDGAPFAG